MKALFEQPASRKPSSDATQAYALYYGRARTPIVEIVADGNGLYRIAWPDIGLSEPVNLARAMQAAQEWAERFFVTEHRKISVVRRLKSLSNFWWSALPVSENVSAYALPPEASK